MRRRGTSYSDHLDTLIALTSYLALTRHRSRTTHELAAALGLDAAEILTTFQTFPGLFRRGSLKEASAGVPPEYNQNHTLHARYARRRHDKPQGPGSGETEELSPEQLQALLAFIAEQARLEKEGHRHQVSQIWVLTGVFVAAAASIAGAFIQVFAA